MNKKSLLASVVAALSITMLAPLSAHANQNGPQEFPTQQPDLVQPAFPSTLAVSAPSQDCTEPAYPLLSARLSQQGSVKVRYQLDQQGNVKTADVVSSSGHSKLDNAAMDALRKCTFASQPGQAAAAPTWQEVKYVWTLD